MIDDLERRFRYHPATDVTAPRHEQVRSELLGAARILDELLEDGREKSLALMKLEESMFWANASIARGL